MMITRPGPPGRRRTRLPSAGRRLPAPPPPARGPPGQRRGQKYRARSTGAPLRSRRSPRWRSPRRPSGPGNASFAVLSSASLSIPAASCSIGVYGRVAVMLRRLLAAGGASVVSGRCWLGLRRQRALGLGSAGRTRPGHGLHVSPLRRAGRGCRWPAGRCWPAVVPRLRRLVVVGGGLASGNILAAAVACPAACSRGRPRHGGSGRAPAAAWRRARAAGRVDIAAGIPALGRPQASRGRSSGPGPSGWCTPAVPAGLADGGRPGPGQLLADAAVLAVSIQATGASVPWHDLLLVYGSGIAAQSLNITPGGLGVTEATLSAALIGAGRVPPGPGCGAALSPGKFLAGRTDRVADPVLATPPSGPTRRAIQVGRACRSGRGNRRWR